MGRSSSDGSGDTTGHVPGRRGRLPLFDVRSGERVVAALFFGYFLLLETAHYATKSVRQASFIDDVGAEQLPWVYLGVALLSFPVLLLYTRLIQRVRHGSMVIVSMVVLATVLVGFWWAFGAGLPGTASVFYVVTTIAFGVAVSQLWSWAAHAFDARQARRLFALIGAGGLLGAIPGGQLAILTARLAGTRGVVLAAAALVLAVAVVAFVIARLTRRRGVDLPAWRTPALSEARGGLDAVLSSPLLLLIVALMVLTVVVGQMVELQFNIAVEGATTQLDERTTVMGRFYSVMGLVAFVLQVLLTQRIHRAAGVGAGLRVLPTVVAVAGLTVVVTMGLVPALVYWAIWGLKIGETSLRHSVDQASRELLFVPVPPELRRRAKAFVDVFVQRAAKGLGAVLLLPVTFHLVGAVHLAVLTVFAAAAWLAVTAAVRLHYLKAFRAGLKSDAGDSEVAVDPGDPATLTTLMESVAASDPHRVEQALGLLHAAGLNRVASPMFLRHESAAVRLRTVEMLAAADRRDAVKQIGSLSEDPDDRVRGAVLRALAGLEGGDAVARLEAALEDPSPVVRGAAAAGLLATGQVAVSGAAEKALAVMAVSRDAEDRREAARALAQVREPTAAVTVVQLLYDEDLEVVRETIESVRLRAERDGGNPMFAPTLVALTANRRLRYEAREALVAFGEAAVQALVHFMNSADEQLPVRRSVPRILARIGSISAGRALADALNTPDVLLRAEVIDALALIARRHGVFTARIRTVRAAIEEETRRYLRDLADLWSVSSLHQARLDGPWAKWPREGRVPTLLQHVLASRMAISTQNLFRLLELMLEPADVRAARRSLASRQAGLRARALEFLDNTLVGTVRRDVACVIDDSPAENKLARADELFGIRQETPEETLLRLVGAAAGGRQRAPILASAAIHTIVVDRFIELYPRLGADDIVADDELVAETVSWAQQRISRGGGDVDMAEMTRIEKMAFLQGVDLFAECSAEEGLRLASIAESRWVEKGEVIFRRDEPPDALYCVVEGRVRLTSDSGDEQVIASGRFGVVDILSGQPRVHTAVADLDGHLLVIEAEDFFDLLAGNIGIVRALFRQVLREVG